jgi:hypothetical protein
MKAIIATIALTLTTSASAACFGSANYYNCFDAQSGNNYSVSKFGNTTSVYGYNSNTGSTWSQNSYQFGNTTNTYGYSSNGQSWSKTDTPYGSYGTNSNGQPFYYGR